MTLLRFNLLIDLINFLILFHLLYLFKLFKSMRGKTPTLHRCLSPSCHPTVHNNVRPGHVRTRVTCEEYTRPHDIFWFGNSTVHGFGLPAVEEVGELAISAYRSTLLGWELTEAVISVFTNPGEMELTRIPCCAGLVIFLETWVAINSHIPLPLSRSQDTSISPRLLCHNRRNIADCAQRYGSPY